MKVIRAERQINSGREIPAMGATMARMSMATETVMPVGMEYFLIYCMNWFLMRAVLGSKARTRPGRPMQMKFSRDISMGA